MKQGGCDRAAAKAGVGWGVRDGRVEMAVGDTPAPEAINSSTHTNRANTHPKAIMSFCIFCMSAAAPMAAIALPAVPIVCPTMLVLAAVCDAGASAGGAGASATYSSGEQGQQQHQHQHPPATGHAQGSALTPTPRTMQQ